MNSARVASDVIAVEFEHFGTLEVAWLPRSSVPALAPADLEKQDSNSSLGQAETDLAEVKYTEFLLDLNGYQSA